MRIGNPVPQASRKKEEMTDYMKSAVGLVKSYLEKADDAVNLESRFASLADGTTYTDTVTLDAPAKNIRLKVDNSGYRKTGN